jgi:hypothetical protein
MNSGAPHRPTVECTAFELTCFRRIARSVSQGRRRRPRSGAQRAQRVQRLDRASTMRLTRQTTPGFVEEPRFLSLEPLLGPLRNLDLRGINWVIVGGESGPKARLMEAEWATDLRDQCRTANVPFFFKQWGGKNKKHTGRVLEGRTWNEMPEAPAESRSSAPKRRLLAVVT